MSLSDITSKLSTQFEGLCSAPVEFRGETTIKLADAQRIAEVCAFARKELGFDYLVDLTPVDNHGEDPRFLLVYELYGYGHRQHLRLKIQVSEEHAEVPTVSTVWRTADWHEREVYDLLGIFFTDHPDLRRILLADDWVGYPLRKDYEYPLEYHGIRCR